MKYLIDQGIYTKWIIVGIIFLVIVITSCFLWYQHEMGPYKREAAKVEELLRQSEKSKQVNNSSKTSEQKGSSAIIVSKTPTAEKPIPSTSDVTNDFKDKEFVSTAKPAKDVPVSPFGFGPYPEVPADYFEEPIWEQNSGLFSDLPDEALKNIELIDRVLIKLWQQGDREIVGGSTYNGKVYPHYDNVFYVHWKENLLPDGSIHRYISRVKGANHEITHEDIESGNIPIDFKIVDLDDNGFNPFQFLNLKQLEE